LDSALEADEGTRVVSCLREAAGAANERDSLLTSAIVRVYAVVYFVFFGQARPADLASLDPRNLRFDETDRAFKLTLSSDKFSGRASSGRVVERSIPYTVAKLLITTFTVFPFSTLQLQSMTKGVAFCVSFLTVFYHLPRPTPIFLFVHPIALKLHSMH
jgi:hypothetical protein